MDIARREPAHSSVPHADGAPRGPAEGRPVSALRILVSGVSGYVGAELVPRLVADGHSVRGLVRDASRVGARIEVAVGDAVSGAGLDDALRQIDVAYYLIHSMEPAAGAGFGARELTAAGNFAAAARAAGVRRIVYLGGIVPNARPSRHLASRLAVERALLTAVPESLALRASIVIGARSRSFRFLVRLIERLPVLALPAWRQNRTAPIDERDVIELLARAARPEVTGSHDIGGPEVVSYGELIERIRDQLLVTRPVLALPRLTLTPIASRVSSVIAGEQHALIGPLMEGLESDLLPRDDAVFGLLGVKRHSLDAAIERALREWEHSERLAAR